MILCQYSETYPHSFKIYFVQTFTRGYFMMLKKLWDFAQWFKLNKYTHKIIYDLVGVRIKLNFRRKQIERTLFLEKGSKQEIIDWDVTHVHSWAEIDYYLSVVWQIVCQINYQKLTFALGMKKCMIFVAKFSIFWKYRMVFDLHSIFKLFTGRY